MRWTSLAATAIVLASPALAHRWSHSSPHDYGGHDNIITIPVKDSGVIISYKETRICEEHARAFAGYVHMPPSSSQNYNVSMFFWYFEARNNPREAPTAIYLAGGAGQSSMFGPTMDGGPCNVNSDSNSTTDNQFSMNTHVNMLYIDQPASVGFSYHTLINATLDMLFLGGAAINDTGIVPSELYDGKVPDANSTFLHGVLPSQDPSKTANTTVLASRTLWSFSQAFFARFPEYKTHNKNIIIWGNSYAGYFIPTTAAYFMSQNAKIRSGALKGDYIELPVDTIGFTNGCIDFPYQAAGWPQMAHNNTYGLEIINKTVYEEAMAAVIECNTLVSECRELGELSDPEQFATNETVNGICEEATTYCYYNVSGPFDVSNRSDFDITHLKPDGSPPYYLAGYFNQPWVQKQLGVPLNFTQNSNLVTNLFTEATGDPIRVEGMKDIEYLLASHVKVALIYGDRDYRCPWTGAESLSLQVNWTGSEYFRDAGYAPVHTNSSYNGGVVRQHGNLSFSRVFEAGHDAYPYQPETIFHLFNRAVFGKDLSSGRLPTTGQFNNYTTDGPSSSFAIKDVLPAPPNPICHMYDVSGTCTTDQYEALVDGSAVIKDFVVISPSGRGGQIVA
ncbi:hypothetical protein LTS10_000380 [Elasticomyces elasticus]|nr:hypothetical protein LTS10_000380 [Elasticomyces elasticus]